MALTDMALRNAKPQDRPYRLFDRGGLHLLVNPDGSRIWRLAYELRPIDVPVASEKRRLRAPGWALRPKWCRPKLRPRPVEHKREIVL